MGRPGPNKDQERLDTLYWCSQIKTYSGKTDAEIEAILFPSGKDGRKDGAAPTGRKFQRWRNATADGGRAMSADDLHLIVQNARRRGLLPPAPSGLQTSRDQRVSPKLRHRPGETLEAHKKSIRTLHRTHQAAIKALEAYAAAIQAAGVEVLRKNKRGAIEEGHHNDVKRMAEDLRRYGFLDLSPWGDRG